jgi:hypothetical protein
MRAEKRVNRILSSALDGVAVLPDTAGDHGAELLLRTRDGTRIAIQTKWAGDGWPEDVRRVAHEVSDPWPENLVLFARHLSPGAIAWLRERDANWADETGQVRILGPNGLLVIREPAARRPEPRSTRGFKWTPSAFCIAEVILAEPDRPLRTAELAELSGWSNAQTANVLKSFDAQAFTVKRGPARGRSAYRELLDADAMLADWTGSLADQVRDVRIAHRATTDVIALLRDELRAALNHNVKWAVSGWAGLELTAPFTTTVPSLHIYIADEDFAGALSAAIKTADLREVDETGRIIFWRADPHILTLAHEYHGVPVVSAPRLYADLSSFGARGQDTADHIKRELIDPLHPNKPSTQSGGTDG